MFFNYNYILKVVNKGEFKFQFKCYLVINYSLYNIGNNRIQLKTIQYNILYRNYP